MDAGKIAIELAVVALGGAIGSAARHAVGIAIQAVIPGAALPWHILIVNVVGCLAIGMLGEYFLLNRSFEPQWLKPMLVAGVLGGLTTFSAVGHDTFRFLENHDFGAALLNVLMNLSAGIGAVAAGVALVRWWQPLGALPI